MRLFSWLMCKTIRLYIRTHPYSLERLRFLLIVQNEDYEISIVHKRKSKDASEEIKQEVKELIKDKMK